MATKTTPRINWRIAIRLSRQAARRPCGALAQGPNTDYMWKPAAGKYGEAVYVRLNARSAPSRNLMRRRTAKGWSAPVEVDFMRSYQHHEAVCRKAGPITFSL